MPKKRTHNIGLKLPPRMYFKHGAFYFVDYDNRWIRLGTDYRKSLDKYHLLIADKNSIKLVRDMIARYVTEELPKLSENTQKTEGYFLKNIRIAFGDWSPHDVKPKHLYQYVDARTKKVAGRREIAVFRKVFDCGIRWGAIEGNPCINLRLPGDKPRTRNVTLREFVSVKRLAGQALADTMEAAFVIAGRKGEILRANKADDKGDTLRWNDTKTGQIFRIAISKRLRRLLDRQRSKDDSLFASPSGKRWENAGLRAAFDRLIQKALALGVIKEKFTFHDIRAAAITYAANKKGLEYARNVGGHKTSRMTGTVYYRGEKERQTTL